ncbi:hypothetical protein ACW4TU_00125 [Streptomyces sp. QTS52]
MAVPTSGATVPLKALPGFHRPLGKFQPLRQITGVVRSILYYDAQGDAGLPRGWVIPGLGLAVAYLFGFGVTRFYAARDCIAIPPTRNRSRSSLAHRPTTPERLGCSRPSSY